MMALSRLCDTSVRVCRGVYRVWGLGLGIQGFIHGPKDPIMRHFGAGGRDAVSDSGKKWNLGIKSLRVLSHSRFAPVPGLEKW